MLVLEHISNEKIKKYINYINMLTNMQGMEDCM